MKLKPASSLKPDEKEKDIQKHYKTKTL